MYHRLTTLPSHGTRGRYVASKCRCPACRRANTAYETKRNRLAKAAAAALAAEPPTPIAKPWTPPGGTRRTRFYRRACPGANRNGSMFNARGWGFACPWRSHLRKDSQRVCERCARLLVWNGLVDAAPARKHLLALRAAGVGRRSVQDACDVTDTVLFQVVTGRKKRIRAETLRRILGVTPEARAPGALVKARPTWRLVRELLREGFTQTELARRLGSKAKVPALQIRRKWITVETAAKVERLYRIVMAGA